MALISTFVPSVTGTAPTYGAAAASDQAEVGDGLWLVVKNGSGSSINCTLTGVAPIRTGATTPNKVYAVSAGGEAWIPLLSPEYRNTTTGYADIAWSSTTTVTRAVVRIG